MVLLHVSLSNAQWEGQLVNGVELCQILKEVAPTTAGSAGDRSTMSGDRERFLEACGADGYLEKPV